MIIISKYKDYYDYLQGIYGRDELKVFRRNINPDFAIRPKDYKVADKQNPRHFLEYSSKSTMYDPWGGHTYYNPYNFFRANEKINFYNVYKFYICGRCYTIEVIDLDNIFIMYRCTLIPIMVM